MKEKGNEFVKRKRERKHKHARKFNLFEEKSTHTFFSHLIFFTVKRKRLKRIIKKMKEKSIRKRG